MSTTRRAPPPSLSFDHSNSARSSPHSNVSTESPFLTPPVLDPRDLSPPPRSDADDYLAARGRRAHKRKHQAGHSRKHCNTREESGNSNPAGGISTSSPHIPSLRASTSEPYEEISNDDGSENVPDAPTVSDARLKTSGYQSRNHQNAADFADVEVQRNSISRVHTAAVSPSQSPAICALRRLSQPVDIEADGDPRTILRMSEAIAASLKVFKPQATKPANDTNRSSRENLHQGSSHYNSPYFQDNDQYGSNTIGSKTPSELNTPAEITLRKASDASFPSPVLSLKHLGRSQTVGATLDKSLQTSESTAELVAFYSQQKHEAKQLQSFGLGSPVNISPIRDPDVTALSNVLARKRTDPIAQFSQNANFRRQSTVAEPTITFADVHIARGTFAVDPKSQKTSSLSPNSPRRMSVVQFCSRNSVHEVIWREDETTDGSSVACSSPDSIGSQPQQQLRQASDPYTENAGSRNQKLKVPTQKDNRLFPVAASLPTNLKQSHTNLFQWSWGRPASNLNMNRQRCSDDLDISTPTGPLTSEPPSVQSFPRLRERSSTSEWHKPLVDLNDPVLGRVPENRVPALVKGANDPAGQYSDVQNDSLAWPSPTEKSRHPNTPARRRESGMPGSNLGSSSRQRIR